MRSEVACGRTAFQVGGDGVVVGVYRSIGRKLRSSEPLILLAIAALFVSFPFHLGP